MLACRVKHLGFFLGGNMFSALSNKSMYDQVARFPDINVTFDKFKDVIEHLELAFTYLNVMDGSLIKVARMELRPLVCNMTNYDFGLIGLCWSWDATHARIYDPEEAEKYFPGKQLEEVTFFKKVNHEEVNWPETLALNIRNPQEREIRLFSRSTKFDYLELRNGTRINNPVKADE